MAIGSLGTGSGLDLESLVNEMVSAQKDTKIRLYEGKITGFEAELSELGRVGAAIDSFKSSAESLNNEKLFTGRNADIAQVEGEEVISIITDNTASNGSYAIDVNQLAKGSRVMSAPGLFSSADDVISKTDSELTFKAGTNEFTLSIAAGTTLSELRNQINTSEDNFGVSANLVDDGNGNLFFTVTSPIQGAENTLTITNPQPAPVRINDIEEASDEIENGESSDDIDSEELFVDELDLAGDDIDYANDGEIPIDRIEQEITDENVSDEENDVGENLSDEATYKPENFEITLHSVSTEGNYAGLNSAVGEQAQDAIITVDGIKIRNDTNLFDKAVAGLSIEAIDLTEKTTKVDVSFDQKTVQETIEEFVLSYNDLINVLEQSTQKDAVLNGNSMIRNLRSSLSSQLMSSQTAPGSTFTSVFDLGIKMENSGILSFDSAKFEDAMKKGYSEIAPLMSGDNGMAQSLVNLLGNYTGSGGMTNQLKDSLLSSIDNSEKALDAYEDRMDRYETSLRSKFSGLDTRLASMNAQGGYLNSVLSNL
jgi:flagellar hook-associated protein 2